MRRGTLLCTLLTSIALAACGGGEVVVTAETEVQNPEGEGMVTRPLPDVEIQLLPYDRDEIFDSLAAAHSEPEPTIPDSLLAAQEQVADAQAEWRDAEAEWNTLRDTLQTLNRRMQQLGRESAEYQLLFEEDEILRRRLAGAERRQEQAFARFDSLQRGIAQQSRELQLAREEWAQEAFADVNDVIEARLRQSGREEHVDTTDASGVVTFEAPAGEWWVHGRFPLPYEELYWNVPVTVASGETHELLLTRENAEVRPIL